jgi:hypothetical protein
MWNFVNTPVKFNGREYTFAFLRSNVPFPIVGLDFLRYFGMQVNPSSTAILIIIIIIISIYLTCREMWLSPVIQATGRQEQWDGSRWKYLTNSNRWISVAALWPAIRRHGLKCASEPHDENSLLDSLARHLL